MDERQRRAERGPPNPLGRYRDLLKAGYRPLTALALSLSPFHALDYLISADRGVYCLTNLLRITVEPHTDPTHGACWRVHLTGARRGTYRAADEDQACRRVLGIYSALRGSV